MKKKKKKKGTEREGKREERKTSFVCGFYWDGTSLGFDDVIVTKNRES